MKKRKTSPSKKFKVFDFSEEDYKVEMDSDKSVTRFLNPRKSQSNKSVAVKRKSPLIKFFEFFTKRTDKNDPQKASVDPIDVDRSSPVRQCAKPLSSVPETPGEYGACGNDENRDHSREGTTSSAKCLSIGVSSAKVTQVQVKTRPKKFRDKPIDVETIGDVRNSVDSRSFSPLMSGEHGASRDDEFGYYSLEGNASPARSFNMGLSSHHSLPNYEPIGVISDDENVTSSFPSELGENEGECRSGEDVIYPKDDADAVTISRRDLELLQPEIFINDTIIDFYMKYMKNQLTSEEKQRFHFFNCFFFRKLATSGSNPSSISEGQAAFQRVRKWTQKVDFFKKDFIIVPVNFSLHWSLIIICHLGEMTNVTDEEVDKLPRLPCILHLDSKRGSHTGLKNIIQSYIYEEWRQRQSERLEDIPENKFNLRFFSLKVPQQENLYDCGLFLLHYVECFLKAAPANLNLFQLDESSNFLSKDWFPPAEASQKRADIHKLLLKMFDDDKVKSQSAETNEIRESIIERLEHMCTSSRIRDDDDTPKIPAEATSPDVQCLRRPMSFQQGLGAESLPLNSPRKNSISSSIKDSGEFEEQVSNTQSNDTDIYEVHSVDAQSVNPKIYIDITEQEEENSCSIRGSVISNEETVVESSSNSCEDFEGFVVQDSQEPDDEMQYDDISTVDFRRRRY